MTKITAIVRADKIHEVEDAIRDSGAPGFTFFDVRGHGREIVEKVDPMSTVPAEYGMMPTFLVADVLPRVVFEVICSEAVCSKTVDAIRKASATGYKGDGIIYTSAVDSVVRILSGEEGDKAL